MAITLEITSPYETQTDVAVDAAVEFALKDSVSNIDFQKTTVDIGPFTAYDGNGAGTPNAGIQAGWSGTVTNNAFGGYDFSLTKDSDLYETFRFVVDIYTENFVATTFSDSYYFDTEYILIVPNSGFEAANVNNAGQADKWGWSGYDPGSQLGTKRGRVNNPVIWSPPEGDHIMGMGSTDLTEALEQTPAPQTFNSLGTGTSSTTDSFSGTLSIPVGHYIIGSSVSVKSQGVEVATDDGLGYLSGTGVSGWIDYWGGRWYVQEDSTQIWDTGEILSIEVQTKTLTFSHVVTTDISERDVTQAVKYRFSYKWAAPASFNTGVTWEIRSFLDATAVIAQDLTTGDESTSTDSQIDYDVISLTGFGHEIQSSLTMKNSTGVALFDNDLYALETFHGWNYANHLVFLLNSAAQAEFDDDTYDEENFEGWAYVNHLDLDIDTATQATFDGGANTEEDFEGWYDGPL